MLNLLGSPSTSFIDKGKNIVFTYVILTVWVFFVEMFLFMLNGHQFNTYKPPVLEALFFGCFMAPLWEELAFRYVPITFANLLGKDFVLPAIVLSSIVFGWGHGAGPISLLVQGVTGFALSCLYLKNNYSYWSAVILHSAWNITQLVF